MANFVTGFGDLGAAVSDLFGASGSSAEAAGFSRAAKLAGQEAKLSDASTAIQVAQTQREAYKVISSQQADVAGAGFAASGSALDLLRSSQSQAALAAGDVATQGEEQTQGFLAQQASYNAQSAAASAASGGGILGGLLKAAAGIAALF